MHGMKHSVKPILCEINSFWQGRALHSEAIEVYNYIHAKTAKLYKKGAAFKGLGEKIL